MSGVRIKHPQLTNCTLVVPHPGGVDINGTPSLRRPKDYHVDLDNDGVAVVSETVWKRLEQARIMGMSEHNFLVLNEIADPPPLALGAIADKRRHQPTVKVDGDVLRGIAPPGAQPRVVTHEVPKASDPRPDQGSN